MFHATLYKVKKQVMHFIKGRLPLDQQVSPPSFQGTTNDNKEHVGDLRNTRGNITNCTHEEKRSLDYCFNLARQRQKPQVWTLLRLVNLYIVINPSHTDFNTDLPLALRKGTRSDVTQQPIQNSISYHCVSSTFRAFVTQ